MKHETTTAGLPVIADSSAASGPKHVVIVGGGGFAGINAARTLGNQKGVRVTVIDQRNHHLFQPLLYQVALAALSPADIASPIRTVLSDTKNVEVFMGNVENVDLKNREVQFGGDGHLTYDYLIMACGASHSYFGRDDWESFAPGLKSVEEATEIRRRVLMAFELAEREPDPQLRKQYLTFVIIGGGPTGVELAGAIGEITRYTLTRDFRNIDPRLTRIILIEAGPRILNAFHEDLAAKAARGLEKLGVTIWTNTRVTDVRPDGVMCGSGRLQESIQARTVLWAAGVQPSELNAKLEKHHNVELGPGGRIKIDPDLSVPGFPEVFVLGDQANFTHYGLPTLPGLAPVAIQMGRHAAKNILNETRGKKRANFRYADKGSMATIGRADAVVQTKYLNFGGLTAWLAWLFVHIFYLIGFKNRLLVFIQWFWSYMTLGRGARLITSRNWKPERRVDMASRYEQAFHRAMATRKKAVQKKQKQNAGKRKTAAKAKAASGKQTTRVAKKK
jgi:NADH dehydrogenase